MLAACPSLQAQYRPGDGNTEVYHLKNAGDCELLLHRSTQNHPILICFQNPLVRTIWLW